MTKIMLATDWPPPSFTACKEILKAAPAMLRRLDAAQHCDWTSAPWLIFSGRTPQQERGLGWTNNVHPEDLSAVLAKLISAASTRGSVHLQYRLRRADGEYCWVEERGGALWRAAGFAGHVLVCTEASARMQEVLALQVAAERARHDAFAHRMKNTLQIILSSLQLQAREAGDGGTTLRHAANRIHGIVAVQDRVDALDNAGQLNFLRLLSEVTSSVIGLQSTLRLDFSAPDVPLLLSTARASTLALLVTEAMTNAIKHGSGRGATTIRVHVTYDPHEMTIEVSDDGPGFPPNVLGADGRQVPVELLLFKSMAAQARAHVTLLNRSGAVVSLRLSFI